MACAFIQCLSAFAANVNLAWDPKSDTGLAGYKIYYGTSSRSYGTPINVGNVTTYTVTGLNSGTYYFGVTAYYTSGSETGFSNEVSTTVTSVTPDSTPPTITLTSPSNGSSSSGTVTVSANASDNIGVAGVQFIVDGVNLGSEDISAPYSVSWNTATVPNGAHTLTARARDAAGNQTISSPITVNVSVTPDSTPPTITLTSPANGSSSSGTATVSANASDNIGVAGVQFIVDGVNLGSEDTSAPHSVSWNTATVSNGAHTLTARARDGAGNQTSSSPITVNVSNTATTLSGLVGAFAFNENSGTTAGDSSGNSNTGSLGGASWTSQGKFSNALSFDGLSNVVTVNDSTSLALSNGMTLEAWVYPVAPLVGWKSVVQKDGYGYYLYGSSDRGNVPAAGGSFGSVSGPQTVFGTAPLPSNTWTHLAAAYDGSVLRLFVNGSQVNSVTVSGGPMRYDPLPLRIAASQYGEFFPGRIDEVRIYNRALTQSEIQNDMNTSIGGTSANSPLPAPTNVSVK